MQRLYKETDSMGLTVSFLLILDRFGEKKMLLWRIFLFLSLSLALVGCKKSATDTEHPTQLKIKTWEEQLRSFSFSAATKSETSGLVPRYKFVTSCPLRYAFQFKQTRQIKWKKYSSMPRIFRVLGEFQLTENKKHPMLLSLSLLHLTSVFLPHPKPKESRLLEQTYSTKFAHGTLQTDSHSLFLRGTPNLLWHRRNGGWFLSLFFPELPASQNDAKKIAKNTRNGFVRSHRKLRHWLKIQEDMLAVLEDSIDLKTRSLVLHHRSTYALLKRGYPLHAHIFRRSEMHLKNSAKGVMQTTLEGEMRLIRACHSLHLTRFVLFGLSGSLSKAFPHAKKTK